MQDTETEQLVDGGCFFFLFLREHTVTMIHTPQVFTHMVVASVLEALLFSVFQFPALQSTPRSDLPSF